MASPVRADGKVRCINCDALLGVPDVAAHRCGAKPISRGSEASGLASMASRGLSLFGGKPKA